MLITDKAEEIRIKLIHGGRFDGKAISFADFILSSSYHAVIDPFALPLTPIFGAKYLTVLAEDDDHMLAIFYLEMNGKSYSINRTDETPYIGGNQDAIKFEWKRMTVGEYYDDNR